MLSKAADQPYNTMTESEQFVIIPWVASWSSAVIIIDPKWGLQYLFIATLLYLNPLRYFGDFYFSHKTLSLSPAGEILTIGICGANVEFMGMQSICSA